MPEDMRAGGRSTSVPKIRLQDGWRWFHSGFERYRRNPVLMTFWVMTYWTILGLLGMLPILGDMLVAFGEFLRNNPDVLYPFIDLITEQYQIHSERILNLQYRSVRERLVSFILTMSLRFGTKTNDGILVDVPLKQQDIASSINASRETTSRELSVLERKGLISNHHSYILIKDKKAVFNTSHDSISLEKITKYLN